MVQHWVFKVFKRSRRAAPSEDGSELKEGEKINNTRVPSTKTAAGIQP